MAKKAAAAPAAEKTTTVQVKALEDHTCLGGSYKCGQTYAAPADLADSLEIQGKAIRTEEGAAIPGSRASRVRAESAVEPVGIKSKARARMAAKPKKGTYKRKDLRAKR